MGCSSEKVTFEAWDGPGLRKETYHGKPSKQQASELSMTKWYCKYLQWTKSSFVTRENYKGVRDEINSYMASMIKEKGWQPFYDKVIVDEFTIKGPDGNDLKAMSIKSKEH